MVNYNCELCADETDPEATETPVTQTPEGQQDPEEISETDAENVEEGEIVVIPDPNGKKNTLKNKINWKRKKEAAGGRGVQR